MIRETFYFLVKRVKTKYLAIVFGVALNMLYYNFLLMKGVRMIYSILDQNIYKVSSCCCFLIEENF